MIKKHTIYRGICDNCGAKLTAWNSKSIVLDALLFQKRSLVINCRTKHYCPRCWKQIKEANNG